MISKFYLNCAGKNMWSIRVKHLRTTYYITVRLPMNSVAGVLYLLTCKITSQQWLIALVTVLVCFVDIETAN